MTGINDRNIKQNNYKLKGCARHGLGYMIMKLRTLLCIALGIAILSSCTDDFLSTGRDHNDSYDEDEGGYITCTWCKGSGDCHACGGDGLWLGNAEECDYCDGCGVCEHCHGTGELEY